MASWSSVELEVLFYLLGWISFCSWAICFYPQLILNFRRKSVQGLNFDFAVLNLTKHTSYLIYNASLFFSSTVQRQYRQKYGFNQAVFNFQRKSTSGFSMGYVSFDFLGSTTSFCQMMVQSIDQRSWVNFYGNIGKTLLSLKTTDVSPSDDAVSKEPMLGPSHDQHQNDCGLRRNQTHRAVSSQVCRLILVIS
ncbi:Cystinosin [Sesamum angolense]|uniref:Cystinosin n=1 Tax=Sesamum angolense TaxID=2727404 RepID=A0AAE1WGB0_9LAMI|nr:Cystinosin [Sesamum angolense]